MNPNIIKTEDCGSYTKTYFTDGSTTTDEKPNISEKFNKQLIAEIQELSAKIKQLEALNKAKTVEIRKLNEQINKAPF